MAIHVHLDARAFWRRLTVASFTLVLMGVLVLASRIAGAATFTVTNNTDDAGSTCGLNCSLRQAINAANADGDASPQIAFDIALPIKAVHTISPGSALPTITHGHLTIDGYTQASAHPNTLDVGDNAVIRIQIDGTAAGLSNGFTICATDVTLRGLSIVSFVRSALAFGSGNGITCAVPGDNGVAEGNFLGLLADGITASGNTGNGVFVSESTNLRVGGTAPAQRNIISANSNGILAETTATTGLQVLGNYIGTDASGSLPRGNAAPGVSLFSGAGDATIGSVDAPNRISYNSNGIRVAGVGNSSPASTGVAAFANDFAGNAGLPIDLIAAGSTPDGPTSNDGNDSDEGGNNLQNFPELLSAELSYGLLRVQGTLDISHAALGLPRFYKFALYAGVACDGASQTFLAAPTAALVDGGAIVQESFTVSSATLPPIGSGITTTATDSNGNTSEFSGCVLMTLGDGIFKDGVDA